MSFWGILSLFLFLACSPELKNEEVDRLNSLSYTFHYRNLDSTFVIAHKALLLSDGYTTGKAEAYNNLAFVYIARMKYDQAYSMLDSVVLSTDNQIELLIADVQYMRLCQRESRNKDFYDYHERALRRLKRIDEEYSSLSERAKMRMVYARSEFFIVSSTYYYYVGLTPQSNEALGHIDPFGDIQKDTAQYLNYLYQVGSGGIIDAKYRQETIQKEFEHLFKCYMLAKRCGFVYWEANSLQSISEHLLESDNREMLVGKNISAIRFINEDDMPDSLLSGYLAQKSLDIFASYGDVYQVAGAYRTLSFCYWELGDYTSSLICLENALEENKLILQAPNLVASIKEHLSLVYSAMDDKNNSDINRNEYLDLQENTRQDRQLEARAEQLERTLMQLNMLIIIIVLLIIVLVFLLFLFKKLRERGNNDICTEDLFRPLCKWKEQNKQYINELNEKHEDINEQYHLNCLRVEKGKIRNVDNKAKVFLVNNVLPYIDRIANEVRKLLSENETDIIRNERFMYISELTDTINDYNDVLTHWIQLQQGQLSLHIESFNLKDIFDILVKSCMSFKMKGIDLNVEQSDIVVKADKVLTLFMLNTLTDNARKFTLEGGRVDILAETTDDYVEISVKDTGVGLSQEELSDIFDRKVNNGHGFGLMNCKGIIDKYRKVSKIFAVCGLFVESEQGKGSRFYFRLPHGIMRAFILFFSVFSTIPCLSAGDVNERRHIVHKNAFSEYLVKAGAYADSAYFSNIKGTYRRTLDFADSARLYLNRHYNTFSQNSKRLMTREDNGLGVPAEIMWFYDNVKTDYDIIMDVRNESAVAALALHEWDLYNYNNKIYTRLFKENSADRRLAEYCLTMQRSNSNKTIAVVILVLLLIIIACSCYFFYYRHVLYFRFCVENINSINKILLSDKTSEEKLKQISSIDISKYPRHLKDLVVQMHDALTYSIELVKKHKLKIELAEDELRRSAYEEEKLYICNNVIDNSLSALKHETMYYPSRIRQLLDDADKNIQAISEVVGYYKELYAILCKQVQRQADTVNYECRPICLKNDFGIDEYVLGDKTLVLYMFDLLKKMCDIKREDISVSLKDYRYVVFDIICRNFNLTDQQCLELFAPTVDNIPFLICRQIVRENSELANLHGCGITASVLEETGTILHIILPRAMKNENLKR